MAAASAILIGLAHRSTSPTHLPSNLGGCIWVIYEYRLYREGQKRSSAGNRGQARRFDLQLFVRNGLEKGILGTGFGVLSVQ